MNIASYNPAETSEQSIIYHLGRNFKSLHTPLTCIPGGLNGLMENCFILTKEL